VKVCHICLSSFFVDGRLYQENELVIQHLADGHAVTVIASTEVHDEKGSITYVRAGSYLGREGAQVIRLPYRRGLPNFLRRKLRMHPGVYRILKENSPDAIMFHGSAGWELLSVARYVRDHPACVFYIDSHSDAVNSGNGWLSRNVLHGQYYRRVLDRALRVAGPLLCVSTSVMEFASDVYRIPRDRLEFYPLGGRPPEDEEYYRLRQAGRDRLGLEDRHVLLVQSGKQSRSKRLLESLRAFVKTDSEDLKLAIAGVLQDDIREEAEALIASDPRVMFLGWQDPEALTTILCAADVYLQPGTQSATMQHSLCCRCAVVIADIPAHQPYRQNNGWFVSGEDDLKEAFSGLRVADLAAMGRNSYEFAKNALDYRRLASRVLSRDR